MSRRPSTREMLDTAFTRGQPHSAVATPPAQAHSTAPMIEDEREHSTPDRNELDQPIPHKPLRLGRKLEDIPETCSCGGCARIASRAYLYYQAPYRHRGKLFVAFSDQVPGYRCNECNYESADLLSSVEVLGAALKKVRKAGDAVAAEQLDTSLSILKQQVARLSRQR